MASEVVFQFKGYTVRHWAAGDRQKGIDIVRTCVEEYGWTFEPEGRDREAIEVEESYQRDERGEFWVVVDPDGKHVGTSAFKRIAEEEKAVEIRKMYLLPEARGKKLGRTLLEALEKRIAEKGYERIYVRTGSVLVEACKLYDSAGYQLTSGDTGRGNQRRVKVLAQQGTSSPVGTQAVGIRGESRS